MKVNGKLYKMSGRRTHEQSDLSGGVIEDGILICSNHFAKFNPTNGAVVEWPEAPGKVSALKSYEAKIENGAILVEI